MLYQKNLNLFTNFQKSRTIWELGRTQDKVQKSRTVLPKSKQMAALIKTYLRSTMTQERISGLAVLSIERDLTNNLKNNPELVVDEFGKQPNRRISFLL